MADKLRILKRLLSLWRLQAGMDLAWLIRDTKIALLAVAADTISSIAAVGGVFLLAWRFDGVGGMNRFEVLFMLGYITAVSGIFTMFCAGNNGHISRIIGRGQLEHMFIQPLSISMQLTTMGFFPFTGSGNLICGGIILWTAVRHLGITLPWWWFLSLLFELMITITIILAQSYLYASAAFYAPVAAEEISTLVIDEAGSLGNYPLSGQPKSLQLPLLTLFPTGLLGWFPSQALLGKPPLGFPTLFPLIIAAVFVLAAQHFFRKGLKHYVQTGSNRYFVRGHRR